MASSVTRKLLVIPPIALGVMALVYFAAIKSPPDQHPPEERVTTVRVIDANPMAFVPRILGYGSVEPEKVWQAVAEVAGSVVYLHPEFKKGQILPKGTEIARLAPTDYDLAVDQINANLRSAEAQLTELDANARNLNKSLEIEKGLLETRQKDLERMQKLYESGTIAKAKLDSEQRNYLAQRQQVQNLENSLSLIPSQRASLEQQVAASKAQLDDAKLDRLRTSIVLPFNARISAVNIELSQFVPVGSIVAEADSIATSEVVAQVPMGKFRRIIDSINTTDPEDIATRNIANVSEIFASWGLSAHVRLRSDQDVIEWEGRFARITDSIDPQTRTVGAVVAVDNSYAVNKNEGRPPLVKGLFVEVELRAKPIDNVYVIPRAALHGDKVYVAGTDARLTTKTVDVTLTQGDIAVLRDGLTAGDRVVVSDISPAINGMLLAPETDTDLAAKMAEAAAGAGSVR